MTSPPLTVRALWESHAAYILRSLRYLGVREAELEDALQETFVIAHQKLARLRVDSTPRAWLYAIALNVARHARRRKVPVSIHDVAPPPDPSDPGGRALARVELTSLLDALDDEQRELVVLYFLEQFTLREIAETLGAPLQTVYSRLGAATKHLEEVRSARKEA